MSTPRVVPAVKALLVDLYDTLVWTDWRALGEHLAARIGIDDAALAQAFDATRVGRGTGAYGSIRGDLAALVNAARGPVATGWPEAEDEQQRFLVALESELVAHLRDAVHLYDDVRPALRALRAAGVPVAIVSNCDHITRPVLDNLALEREVDATVLSCEVGSLKPDTAIFEQALARIGAPAAGTLFIDDQARYLDGARALGIATARIVRASSYDDPPEGAHDGAHPVICSLTGLVTDAA